MTNRDVRTDAGRIRWIAPLLPRSTDEEHRAATPLELFFDLVFVVAIAQASVRLHHALAAGHAAAALLSYAMIFFAIWWAWMNFTWFASAYDTDDVAYRLVVFIQLAGALIMAAGVPRAFDEHAFGVVLIGYVVMRLALVTQWVRVARCDPTHRATALRYAAGVGLCQIGWAAWVLLSSPGGFFGFTALAIAEMLVPAWAERAESTSWHPEHIAERYGLFTIIVLGESILAASIAIQSAIDAGDLTSRLTLIIIGGLLTVFSLWWIYFDQPVHHLLTSTSAFAWGYGHYLIFASAAAVGAGLAVSVDQATGHSEIGAFGAGAAVALPVALYVTSVWALHERHQEDGEALSWISLAVAALVLLSPVTGHAVFVTGLLLATLVATRLVRRHRAHLRVSTV
jgi:low temperature requirement protein LtrA